MSFDKENPEIVLLVQTFEKHLVRYIIVGGFAVNRYGYNRTTGDLDIYIEDSKKNRQRLIDALEDMGYGRFDILMTAPIIAGYCEILMDDGMYADLMTDIPGLDQANFTEYYHAATVDYIGEFPIRFIHYNHLIKNKLATGRPKDRLDVEELERIRSKK